MVDPRTFSYGERSVSTTNGRSSHSDSCPGETGHDRDGHGCSQQILGPLTEWGAWCLTWLYMVTTGFRVRKSGDAYTPDL